MTQSPHDLVLLDRASGEWKRHPWQEVHARAENIAERILEGTACAVALIGDAKGGQRRTFRRCHRFHVEHRTEEHRHALVDDDERGAVAFLGIDAHMGFAGAGRHLPVDGAHVIRRQVVAQFLEVQPASAQARSMATVQHAARGLARQEADPSCLRLEPAQMRKIDRNARIRAGRRRGGRKSGSYAGGTILHGVRSVRPV